MGFCRRCGEITTGDRCRCGGTSKEPAVKPLFAGGESDKWGQRYLSRTPSPSSTSPAAAESTSPKRPPRRPASSSRPPSPSKLRSFTGALEDDGGELSSVFGSVLSPQDNWCCISCERKFVQEEVIYPHPDAKANPEDFGQVYFCRQCFADRFAKGVCKKCKFAVLSDAPFIKHDDRLWHDTCFVCSYCSSSEEIIMDFASQPSCEACFDSAAYKTKGIPPSPHLAQGAFFAPPKLKPAPSKWGSGSVGKKIGTGNPYTSAGAASVPASSVEPPKVPSSRLRMEREKSPMVQSFNELGDRLRKAGLDDSPSRPAVNAPSTVYSTRTETGPKPVTTARPLATTSFFTRPLNTTARGAPHARSDLTATPPSAAMRPTHARAWSLNTNVGLRGTTSPGTTSLSGPSSRPAHGRTWSLSPASADKPSHSRPASTLPMTTAATLPHKDPAPSLRPVPPAAPARGEPLAPIVPSPRRQAHYSLKPVHSTVPISSVPASSLPVAGETCPACLEPLGYGEFASLQDGSVLHRACFVCGGCGQMLDAGKHAQVDGKAWHAQCAPPPKRYRSIATSLAEPPSPSDSATAVDLPRSPVEAALEEQLAICTACSKPLGVGQSITVPSSGKSFHADCFKCEGCGMGFVSEGRRGFVQSEGRPYHAECVAQAPAAASAFIPSCSSNPLRSSTSRALPLPPTPSQPKVVHSTSTLSSSLLKSPSQASIFSSRPRPPSNLGGLLICAGCSVRATMSETVPGPRSTRWHAKCLRCGGCGRGLDSEAKVNERGEVRCEGCRKTEARTSFRIGEARRVV